MQQQKKITPVAGAIINLRPLTREARIVQFNDKGRLGITNLKTTIDVLLSVGKDAGALLNDGPTTAEGVALALTILDAAGKIEVYKSALAELRDLDPTEAKKLTQHFGFAFDIENNELEAKIEQLIELLPRAYEFIVSGIGLFVEFRSVVSAFQKAA